jgi:hypothetical protein
LTAGEGIIYSFFYNDSAAANKLPSFSNDAATTAAAAAAASASAVSATIMLEKVSFYSFL